MKIRQKAYNREWTKNILRQISYGKKYSAKIFPFVKTTQATVYRQLIILQKEGFVHSHREKFKNKLVFDLTTKGKLLLSYFKDVDLLRNKYKEILR